MAERHERAQTRFMSKKHFREWRDFRGLTQEQVAGRTGIDNTILSKLERGKVNYTEKHLEALSHAYNCTPADLLTPPPDRSGSDDDIARYLRKLKSREDRAKVARILAALAGEDAKTGT